MAGVLQDRVAVITGSGEGIGRATALAMAKEGAKIVIADIAADLAEAVAHEITVGGGEAIAFVGDISDFEATEKLMRAAVDKFGKLDILHNNAGISSHQPIYEFKEKDWDRVVRVDLKGVFNCTRHAAPYMMKQKWGRIINASSNAWRGTTHNSAYSASKAGVLGLTGTTAKDLAPYGVTCNAYLPHAATRMTMSEENRARFTRGFKEGHYTKAQFDILMNEPPPDTIPPLLVYLCTEDAAKITGRIFDIAGEFITIFGEPGKKTTIFKKEGWWTVPELAHVVPGMLQ